MMKGAIYGSLEGAQYTWMWTLDIEDTLDIRVQEATSRVFWTGHDESDVPSPRICYMVMTFLTLKYVQQSSEKLHFYGFSYCFSFLSLVSLKPYVK